MNKRSERTFIIILQLTATIAVIGIGLLIYTRWQNGPSAVFDLLAYVVSIAALAMTTLQSISISKQVRITENAGNKISVATKKLESLIATDKLLTTEIKKDIELDKKSETDTNAIIKEESEIEQKIDLLIKELSDLRSKK